MDPLSPEWEQARQTQAMRTLHASLTSVDAPTRSRLCEVAGMCTVSNRMHPSLALEVVGAEEAHSLEKVAFLSHPAAALENRMNEHDYPDEQEGYETDEAGTFKG